MGVVFNTARKITNNQVSFPLQWPVGIGWTRLIVIQIMSGLTGNGEKLRRRPCS